MAALHHFLKDRRGNSATEFAFIFPVMLTLIVGIVETGRFFQAYDGVNRLTTRYASVYADCNDGSNNACNTELSLYSSATAIRNIAPQLNGTPVVSMYEVQYSPTGTLTIIYPSSGAMTSAQKQVAYNAIYTAGLQQTGVLVTVNYTHSIMFFSSLFNSMVPGIASKLAVSYTVAQRKN